MSRPKAKRGQVVTRSSFATLAKATGAGKRLARLREALIPSKGLHCVIIGETQGFGQTPVGPYRGAMFVGDWTDEEREAWLAEALNDPRMMAPPSGPASQPPTEITLPGGGRIALTNSEPALASDGRPAKALPPSRTQYLPPSKVAE